MIYEFLFAQLRTLNTLFSCTNALLVGSGKGEHIEMLKALDVKNAILVEADEQEIEKMLKLHKLPSSYKVENALIYKDEESVEFNIATNPTLNCVKDVENYRNVMPNVTISKVKVMRSYSVDTFLENHAEKKLNWMLIDTFTAIEILTEVKKTFETLEVVICKILLDKSKKLEKLMVKNGFILVSTFDENNPQIKLALYIKNYKQNFFEIDENNFALFNQIKTLQSSIESTQQREDEYKNELELLKKLMHELVQKRDNLINEVKEKDVIIKSFLESPKGSIPLKYFSKLDYVEKIDAIANYCMKQDDILEIIDNFILVSELNENEKFDLCCLFSLKIAEYGDRYQGVNFLNNARYFLDKSSNKEQYKKLIELASSLNSIDLAVDLEMEFNEKYGVFSPEINKKIFKEYKNIRNISLKKQAHGHDLLIDYIEKNVKDNDQTGKIFVEIGTTRENIPGQGSTMELAQLCKRKNIKFITVDMDPHNTRWANFISKRLNLNFQAITKKGEDYLMDDIESFDFVFLDAYDFDHGMHSDLRQSRYEQNLGSKIDENECHLMHLECAKSVVKKLKKNGVVCVDDTWLDENKNWTAKGTLAVPFLLDNRYQVVVERNKAILLNNKEIN